MLERVIAYIDGFNLYFGLKSHRWQRYYWLNIQLLAQHLLKSGQELIFCKYFTSRIATPNEKAERQSTYIQALETLNNVQIIYGKYQANPRKCKNCGVKEIIQNEKMTDVNIAIEMLSDAFEDKYDTALLISADSDLTPSIISIKKLFPAKRVIAVFPPGRYSQEMSKYSHAYFTIGRANLAKSLFSDIVTKADGFNLQRPETWK